MREEQREDLSGYFKALWNNCFLESCLKMQNPVSLLGTFHCRTSLQSKKRKKSLKIQYALVQMKCFYHDRSGLLQDDLTPVTWHKDSLNSSMKMSALRFHPNCKPTGEFCSSCSLGESMSKLFW